MRIASPHNMLEIGTFIYLCLQILHTSKVLLKQQMMRMDGNMEAMEKILYNHWKLETILLSTQLQVMKRNVSFMLLQETDL
jgi:hypothetical protein